MNSIDYPQAIKALKNELQMTDAALAKHLGASVASLYNWAKGTTAPSGGHKTRLEDELRKYDLIPGDMQEEVETPQPKATRKRARKTSTAQGKSRAKKGAAKNKPAAKEAAVSADKNLLKTYYVQMAAENKISKFHLELDGVSKKHSKDITPEMWADIMVMLEEI
ncbi:MAG: helix-turn-helix domain-containing protein [Methanococcaceae archaeon]